MRRGALLAAPALVLLLVGCGRGGPVHDTGTSAGHLDAGSVVGASFGLDKGESYTVGLVVLENRGTTPAVVESIRPLSTSPSLRATPGHLWLVPRNNHLSLPNGWPGWPPRNPPTKRAKWMPKSWVQPHPNLPRLPERLAIPPGREAQIVYGIFLHANPSPKIGITSLRITFRQGGTTYVWTLPEPVKPR